MKIKTTKGTINNNTTKHKITRDTATIFNFNIDNVTLASNTLTVTCTTITDETITYTLNLASGEKELPTALENLNVAGDINLFLAIAYKLYEAGLEPQPPEPQPGQEPNIIVLDSIDCENLSYGSFLGGYYNGKIGFGGFDITLGAQYPQNTTTYRDYVDGLIEVESCTIGETEIPCSQSIVFDNSTIVLRLQPNDSTTIDYNDEPIPVVTVIKNKQNDTTYTVEDTIEVQGNNVIFTNGGGAVTNYLFYNDTLYKADLLQCGGIQGETTTSVGARFTITNMENTIMSAETIGFSTRCGNAQFKDADNNTITYKIKVNDTYKDNAQPTRPFNNEYEQLKYPPSGETVLATDTVTVEIIIADENNNIISQAVLIDTNPTPYP